jgi:hypothetical protein
MSNSRSLTPHPLHYWVWYCPPWPILRSIQGVFERDPRQAARIRGVHPWSRLSGLDLAGGWLQLVARCISSTPVRATSMVQLTSTTMRVGEPPRSAVIWHCPQQRVHRPGRYRRILQPTYSLVHMHIHSIGRCCSSAYSHRWGIETLWKHTTAIEWPVREKR